MDFLIEILFEIYGELMLLIVPDKHHSKRYILLSKIVAIFGILITLGLAIWGGVLIADYNNILGTVPLALAVIISLAQIVAGIVLYKKNHRE